MIHTLNGKGLSDTLNVDHLSTYRVVAQTIPPASIDSVTLTAGKHNHIGMDAPQGYLFIRTTGGKAYDLEKILVKKAGTNETINIQFMGTVEKYLTGKYDLEIPVFPFIRLQNVEILQSYTTTVDIPEPGLLNINSGLTGGYGSLYQLNKDGDQIWVSNLRAGVKNQKIYLQPGTYRIVYRRADYKSSSYSIIRDFKIDSGITVSLDLQ